ncbi:hypothetical protein LR48_Vigan04g081000 [Vigna angularis]|uniref:Uncharacterized protein n=2 Tax=Phaseolus angularis TaxID=3914 RepID=A0A0L9UDI5_PHAAN|nr:hypothetical protein LR48_Vigan04g081000 [Vigna angularis]BAT79392.1 hypothetical protein VIGAN_02226800 [Vigna angularis var. angularis]
MPLATSALSSPKRNPNLNPSRHCRSAVNVRRCRNLHDQRQRPPRRSVTGQPLPCPRRDTTLLATATVIFIFSILEINRAATISNLAVNLQATATTLTDECRNCIIIRNHRSSSSRDPSSPSSSTVTTINITKSRRFRNPLIRPPLPPPQRLPSINTNLHHLASFLATAIQASLIFEPALRKTTEIQFSRVLAIAQHPWQPSHVSTMNFFSIDHDASPARRNQTEIQFRSREPSPFVNPGTRSKEAFSIHGAMQVA